MWSKARNGSLRPSLIFIRSQILRPMKLSPKLRRATTHFATSATFVAVTLNRCGLVCSKKQTTNQNLAGERSNHSKAEQEDENAEEHANFFHNSSTLILSRIAETLRSWQP